MPSGRPVGSRYRGSSGIRGGTPPALLAAAAVGAILIGCQQPVDGLANAETRRCNRAGTCSIIPVAAGTSWAYLVLDSPDTPQHAALIDCGSEPEAAAILSALSRVGLDASAVRAIFVTHGHLDHYAGILQFPQAQVFAGAYTVRVLSGNKLPQAKAARLASRLRQRPRVTASMITLMSGMRVSLPWLTRENSDDAPPLAFTALTLPGHARDSIALSFGGTLFVGDALLWGDGEPRMPSRWWTADSTLARQALRRLLLVGPDWQHIADGHTGMHAFSAATLEDFVMAQDAR